MLAKKQKSHKRFLIKILVVGPSGCGKTSLIHRFVTGNLPVEEHFDVHTQTVGLDFMTKSSSLLGSKVTLQIWDTCGEPDSAFLHLGNCFFRGINVVMFCFDVSSPTIQSIESWRKALVARVSQASRRTHIKFVALACKLDLVSDHLYTRELSHFGLVDDNELQREEAWRENFLQHDSSPKSSSQMNDGGVTLLDTSAEDVSPMQSPQSPAIATSYPALVAWSRQNNMGQPMQCCASSGFGLLGDESVFMQVTRTVLDGLKKELASSTTPGETSAVEGHTDIHHKQEWTKDPEASPDMLSHGLAQLNLLPGSDLHLKHAESFNGGIGPQWQRDRDAPRCNGCKKAFGMFLRRHHCRRCGKIFCDGCTPHRGPVIEWGYNGQERQCDDCWQVTLRGQQIFPEEEGGLS